MEPGAEERFALKVDKIETKKIDNGKLFEPPGGYHEIQATQF
jgi:hypothetical protein